MCPQDLLFKAQDGVLGGGMGHRIGFQPSGGCFHHCEHTALALAGQLIHMLPVQIHLSHFNLSSLIHLLVVLMFLSGPT